MDSYGKILLVEDDQSLATWIGEYLTEHGFLVKHVSSGKKVASIVKNGNYCAILLDVMLPDKDGIEICREIRLFSQLPILMMTARADEFDEVVGLEVGANDYIIKPVRPRAMLARLKHQLRAANSIDQSPEKNHLKFGKLEINCTSNKVTYRSTEIKLTTGLFTLLSLLAKDAGQAISREAVFSKIVGREYDGLDRRVDVMISALRKKLDDNPQDPQKIKTIWGKGYLFVPDAWDD